MDVFYGTSTDSLPRPSSAAECPAGPPVDPTLSPLPTSLQNCGPDPLHDGGLLYARTRHPHQARHVRVFVHYMPRESSLTFPLDIRASHNSVCSEMTATKRICVKDCNRFLVSRCGFVCRVLRVLCEGITLPKPSCPFPKSCGNYASLREIVNNCIVYGPACGLSV
jgi:hypothetical protein